jgi:hypothetical protein
LPRGVALYQLEDRIILRGAVALLKLNQRVAGLGALAVDAGIFEGLREVGSSSGWFDRAGASATHEPINHRVDELVGIAAVTFGPEHTQQRQSNRQVLVGGRIKAVGQSRGERRGVRRQPFACCRVVDHALTYSPILARRRFDQREVMPGLDPAAAPFHFSLGLEIGIAAVLVCGLWRLIDHQEARFWAWRPRGFRPALAVSLKMIGLYLFAAALSALLPVLTHVFDVRAESQLGAAFLVAEAVAAGLATVMLARRKATARQDPAADIPAEAPGWVEKALTACFVSLGDDAKAGVRQRLGEALASDEVRIRLLGALRDYAKDAGEDDESSITLVVLFISDWPGLSHDDQNTTTDTVRDFVVERRIARRRLIPKNSK